MLQLGESSKKKTNNIKSNITSNLNLKFKKHRIPPFGCKGSMD